MKKESAEYCASDLRADRIDSECVETRHRVGKSVYVGVLEPGEKLGLVGFEWVILLGVAGAVGVFAKLGVPSLLGLDENGLAFATDLEAQVFVRKFLVLCLFGLGGFELDEKLLFELAEFFFLGAVLQALLVLLDFFFGLGGESFVLVGDFGARDGALSVLDLDSVEERL